MESCAKCHRRTWARDDEDVDLGGVLATLAHAHTKPDTDR